MSYDISLVRYANGQHVPANDGAMKAVLARHPSVAMHSDVQAFSGDGNADFYIGADDSMVSIFGGSASLTQLIFDIAVAADLVIFFPSAARLKTAVVNADQLEHLPPDLRTGVVDVNGDPGSPPIVCTNAGELEAAMGGDYAEWEEWLRRDYADTGPVVLPYTPPADPLTGLRRWLGRLFSHRSTSSRLR